MPTSDRGSERRAPAGRRARGFTLIELLIVITLVALGTSVVSLALRDRTETRLEEEGARLALLLESARAEARAAGLEVRWRPAAPGDAPGLAAADAAPFRFVGLPASLSLPTRWLDARTSAQVAGASALLLGPDAILPAQRVLLQLDDRRIEVASDGLAPFAVRPAAAAGP